MRVEVHAGAVWHRRRDDDPYTDHTLTLLGVEAIVEPTVTSQWRWLVRLSGSFAGTDQLGNGTEATELDAKTKAELNVKDALIYHLGAIKVVGN